MTKKISDTRHIVTHKTRQAWDVWSPSRVNAENMVWPISNNLMPWTRITLNTLWYAITGYRDLTE